MNEHFRDYTHRLMWCRPVTQEDRYLDSIHDAYWRQKQFWIDKRQRLNI